MIGQYLRLLLATLLNLGYFCPAHGQLRAHFIDVGQGAATLLEFPCAAVLIDAGAEQSPALAAQPAFDGTQALLKYLDAFFERRGDLKATLHTLVLTHPHADHTSGVAGVLGRYKVRNAVTNGQTWGSGSKGQIALHERVKATEDTADDSTDDIAFLPVSKSDVEPARGLPGPAINGPGCATVQPRITLLWGAVAQQGQWALEDFRDSNNHSVVVRVDYGAASMLVTGDLETPAIADLIAFHRGSQLLNVDGYAVGHHGSANGTSVELLQAMSPDWAVIAAGPATRRGDYTAYQHGHPRTRIVTALLQSVKGTRPTVFKPAATGQFKFVTRKISKAVYSTGWDGTVILEAASSGSWKKINQIPAEEVGAQAQLLNINSASEEQLANLPMVGADRARRIVLSREREGPFKTLDDLTRVEGIGVGTVRLLRRFSTL